jgi:murein DD-endopeptidase MepM/ murein hydrolase activator NlpD
LSVAAQSRRPARRAFAADLDAEERRGWLSHGLAALVVSGLGLAVAGSVALTTNAQTSNTVDGPIDSTVTLGDRQPLQPQLTNKAAGQKKVTDSASLSAFAPRAPEIHETSRTAEIRTAIVNERAAQRAENLSKIAEDVARAARAAGTDARAESLAAGDRAVQKAALQLAQERLRRAIAERIAAESKRAETERAVRSSRTSTRGLSTSTGSVPAGSYAVSPVPGAVIGAYFGQYGMWSRYHTGLDFRAAYGTPIRAVKSGVVLYAGNSGDWAGNHVALRHADGMTTMSSHMSSIAVGSGQSVQAGQIIGYVGQSGRAFGAHLHFELYPVGVEYGDVYRAINPQPWLNAAGVNTY